MSSHDHDPVAGFATPCLTPEQLLLIARSLPGSRGASPDQRHLEVCAGCQAEFERVLLELDAEAPGFVPSESLVDRTLARRSVALARPIAPAAQTAPAVAPNHLRRVAGLAAAGIVVLGVGLLWGIGTGVAAAHAESAGLSDEPFSLAVIRNMPMGRALTGLSCGPVAAVAQRAPAQQSIPTIDLPAASAKTTLPIDNFGAMRQLADGRLLVLDGRNGLRLFDATLGSAIALGDSATGTTGSRTAVGQITSALDAWVGAATGTLIRYLGDSTLRTDQISKTVKVLDASGRVARTMPLPDAAIDLTGPSYADSRGRVLFAGRGRGIASSDSGVILRVDFASGRVDTVGRTRAAQPSRLSYFYVGSFDSLSPRGGAGASARTPLKSAPIWITPSAMARDSGTPPARLMFKRDSAASTVLAGFSRIMPVMNAVVPDRDDWALLSDGSLAIVRGHDYHIDWMRPDGTMRAGPRLAFDWQRLYEESRQQPSPDPAIAEYRRALTTSPSALNVRLANGTGSGCSGTGRQLQGCFRSSNGRAMYPVVSDLDGNLWVLPTIPASPDSGLVYDVINGQGELFERVRIPAGRSIAGFGKGGVVYLLSGAPTNLALERVRMK